MNRPAPIPVKAVALPVPTGPFFFSIIVPTYNRRDVVVDSLRSITAADRPWPCELIVVVDGSTDGTADAVRALELPMPVTVIEQRNSGAAAARNRGAAAARGERLLFLDDDMTAHPRLLVRHEESFAQGADVVLGVIGLDPRSPDTLLTRGVQRWITGRTRRLSRTGGRPGVADFLTGQLSVRADCFTQAGGFDGALTAGGTFGGEDTDLVYRLLQHRTRIVFNAGAVSLQRYVVDAAQNLRQWEQAGRADAALSRKHPGLGRIIDGLHNGRGLSARAARTLARLPSATVQPVAERLVRRIDLGHCDLPTGWAYTKVRDIAYWRGARSDGGIRRDTDPGVRVLAYHQVADLHDPRLARYAVPPAVFAEQISALLAAGHTFLTADDLLEHLDGRPLAAGSVLLTFDDAYASFYEHALPVLRRHGITGVVCAVTSQLGGHNAWDAGTGATRLPLLDAGHLRELHAAGWEIAAHTHRHEHLTRLPVRAARAELETCARAIAGLGLPGPRLLAYPYGEHNHTVRALAARAGFRAAFGLTTRDAWPVPQSRYALARIEVQRTTSPAALLRRIAGPARVTARHSLRAEAAGLVGRWRFLCSAPEQTPDLVPEGATSR
ncbi:MAG TPA: polysaccharide deacetylase family protein [Actinoplanes sp.]|nr:polysaccharide deacetylase family protein [Actinoplanes sp.]